MRILSRMNPMRRIRTEVFPDVSQAEMGRIARVTQATVSRWESGDLQPGLFEMSRIREAAKERGIEWDDSLFFDPSPSQSVEAAE